MAVAGSLSHAYVAGRVENDAGTGYAVLQYNLGLNTPQLRSSETFPLYLGSGYEAKCMTSISLGEVDSTHGFQYTQVVVAGTVPNSSGKLVPAIASFETKPVGSGGSGIGDLRLMWSGIRDADGSDDEVPLRATTDGSYVAVVSRRGTDANPAGLTVRVYQILDGKEILRKTYADTGVTPAGVFLFDNYVVVGGSGPNSSGVREMMVLAYAVNEDGAYSIQSGDLFGPEFTSSGSGRTFNATCMCSSENNQTNFNGGNYFAIAGRSYSNSSTSDGDWFVHAQQFGVNATTHHPVFTSVWASTGKSTSQFDDVPVAMCVGLTPENYGGEQANPLPAHFRLWVTGNRFPLSGGKSEATTVQYDMEGTDGIEWYNHFAVEGRNVVPVSIGAMDFKSGLSTRAYVGGFIESTTSGYGDDYLMLKYSSEPTTSPLHGDRANLWGSSAVYAATGTQRSASIMPLHPEPISGTQPGRVILITGFSGGTPDMFTQRYTDSND